MSREVLTIEVDLTGVEKVQGPGAEACMILFGGRATGEEFTGTILAGGVDTQVEYAGAPRTLSARYMLEGTDPEGNACRVFIENNGTADADGRVTRTRPRIITDSPCLAYLQDADLEGSIEPREGGVLIRICQKMTID